MKAALYQLAALGTLLAATSPAGAQDAAAAAAADKKPEWTFGVTAYPTNVRGGDNYTSAVAAADRGPLRLEARVNYEMVGARSAFIGWTFSGGEDLTWSVRPLIGGAWGDLHAVIPAVEASVGYRRVDFYIEAEYVRPSNGKQDSYTYAWSELGFKPVEWLRLGLVGQRTKAYGGDREFQRGPFVQLTWSKFTLGGYWFNPGSNEQVFVTSLGVVF